MPRRKSAKAAQLPLRTSLIAAAVVASLWLAAREAGLLLLVALVVGSGIVAVLFVLPARRHRQIVEKADTLIQHHAEQLGRRRAQLVRLDAYGKPVLDKWRAESDHFALQHVRPSLSDGERSFFDKRRNEFTALIAQHIELLVPKGRAFEKFTDSMRPSEFEAFCAEELQKAGWTASITQASRDQGVDVIAEKGGVRAVLQCKLYSNPVGNKAVQEIVAGRAHERATWGAVVTNSTYTSPAEELASTNGILLLHFSDLARLDDLLANASISQTANAGS